MTRFKFEDPYAWYQYEHWYFRVDVTDGGGEVVFRKPFLDQIGRVKRKHETMSVIGDLTREMEAAIAEAINAGSAMGPIPCDEQGMHAVTMRAEQIMKTWYRGHISRV